MPSTVSASNIVSCDPATLRTLTSLRIVPGHVVGVELVLSLGEQSFQMVADNDVAEKLIRYSARRRVNSAGRKPSWYGA